MKANLQHKVIIILHCDLIFTQSSLLEHKYSVPYILKFVNVSLHEEAPVNKLSLTYTCIYISSNPHTHLAHASTLSMSCSSCGVAGFLKTALPPSAVLSTKPPSCACSWLAGHVQRLRTPWITLLQNSSWNGKIKRFFDIQSTYNAVPPSAVLSTKPPSCTCS